MILDSEISSIKTGWREIIENWKKENPDTISFNIEGDAVFNAI